jgi:hypothetical protein
LLENTTKVGAKKNFPPTKPNVFQTPMNRNINKNHSDHNMGQDHHPSNNVSHRVYTSDAFDLFLRNETLKTHQQQQFEAINDDGEIEFEKEVIAIDDEEIYITAVVVNGTDNAGAGANIIVPVGNVSNNESVAIEKKNNGKLIDNDHVIREVKIMQSLLSDGKKQKTDDSSSSLHVETSSKENQNIKLNDSRSSKEKPNGKSMKRKMEKANGITLSTNGTSSSNSFTRNNGAIKAKILQSKSTSSSHVTQSRKPVNGNYHTYEGSNVSTSVYSDSSSITNVVNSKSKFRNTNFTSTFDSSTESSSDEKEKEEVEKEEKQNTVGIRKRKSTFNQLTAKTFTVPSSASNSLLIVDSISKNGERRSSQLKKKIESSKICFTQSSAYEIPPLQFLEEEKVDEIDDEDENLYRFTAIDGIEKAKISPNEWEYDYRIHPSIHKRKPESFIEFNKSSRRNLENQDVSINLEKTGITQQPIENAFSSKKLEQIERINNDSQSGIRILPPIAKNIDLSVHYRFIQQYRSETKKLIPPAGNSTKALMESIIRIHRKESCKAMKKLKNPQLFRQRILHNQYVQINATMNLDEKQQDEIKIKFSKAEMEIIKDRLEHSITSNVQ